MEGRSGCGEIGHAVTIGQDGAGARIQVDRCNRANRGARRDRTEDDISGGFNADHSTGSQCRAGPHRQASGTQGERTISSCHRCRRGDGHGIPRRNAGARAGREGADVEISGSIKIGGAIDDPTEAAGAQRDGQRRTGSRHIASGNDVETGGCQLLRRAGTQDIAEGGIEAGVAAGGQSAERDGAGRGCQLDIIGGSEAIPADTGAGYGDSARGGGGGSAGAGASRRQDRRPGCGNNAPGNCAVVGGQRQRSSYRQAGKADVAVGTDGLQAAAGQASERQPGTGGEADGPCGRGIGQLQPAQSNKIDIPLRRANLMVGATLENDRRRRRTDAGGGGQPDTSQRRAIDRAQIGRGTIGENLSIEGCDRNQRGRGRRREAALDQAEQNVAAGIKGSGSAHPQRRARRHADGSSRQHCISAGDHHASGRQHNFMVGKQVEVLAGGEITQRQGLRRLAGGRGRRDPGGATRRTGEFAGGAKLNLQRIRRRTDIAGGLEDNGGTDDIHPGQRGQDRTVGHLKRCDLTGEDAANSGVALIIAQVGAAAGLRRGQPAGCRIDDRVQRRTDVAAPRSQRDLALGDDLGRRQNRLIGKRGDQAVVGLEVDVTTGNDAIDIDGCPGCALDINSGGGVDPQRAAGRDEHRRRLDEAERRNGRPLRQIGQIGISRERHAIGVQTDQADRSRRRRRGQNGPVSVGKAGVQNGIKGDHNRIDQLADRPAGGGDGDIATGNIGHGGADHRLRRLKRRAVDGLDQLLARPDSIAGQRSIGGGVGINGIGGPHTGSNLNAGAPVVAIGEAEGRGERLVTGVRPGLNLRIGRTGHAKRGGRQRSIDLQRAGVEGEYAVQLIELGGVIAHLLRCRQGIDARAIGRLTRLRHIGADREGLV